MEFVYESILHLCIYIYMQVRIKFPGKKLYIYGHILYIIIYCL